LRNNKVYLKGGKRTFLQGIKKKGRLQCDMGYIAGALSNNPRADIIIYHKGDIGKGPMIITVFGVRTRAKSQPRSRKNTEKLLDSFGCSGVTLRVTIESPFMGHMKDSSCPLELPCCPLAR
jgi:hypothetical protein